MQLVPIIVCCWSRYIWLEVWDGLVVNKKGCYHMMVRHLVIIFSFPNLVRRCVLGNSCRVGGWVRCCNLIGCLWFNWSKSKVVDVTFNKIWEAWRHQLCVWKNKSGCYLIWMILLLRLENKSERKIIGCKYNIYSRGWILSQLLDLEEDSYRNGIRHVVPKRMYKTLSGKCEVLFVHVCTVLGWSRYGALELIREVSGYIIGNFFISYLDTRLVRTPWVRKWILLLRRLHP